MELQFENVGSNLKVTVGNPSIKVLSHSISQNAGGEYELTFEVTESGSQNNVVLEGYNFLEGGSSNYEATITEGGGTQSGSGPTGTMERPGG